MTDLRERIRNRPSRDVWETDPDWMMLGICAVLLVGWALWLGIIAYRLLMPGG